MRFQSSGGALALHEPKTSMMAYIFIALLL